MQSVPQVLAAAAAAFQSGEEAEAEALWRTVLDRGPEAVEAFAGLARLALRRGAPEEALSWIGQAQAFRPQDAAQFVLAAEARRALGHAAEEAAAIAAALAADAYCWPALLMRGQNEERAGAIKVAAQTYRHLQRIAPPPAYRPASYREALAHAERIVGYYNQALEVSLLEALGDGAGGDPRWREAAAIMAGRTRPYHADCNQLTVPRLPAITFYDRALFPWIEQLEARTAAIRAEMAEALTGAADAFAPYIQYRPGDPVNQWAELNHSRRWSSFPLYRYGAPVVENLARCPETAAALASIEMAEIAGLCPNAMFSVLAPHTEIPPHHGETNARLVAHLPLVVPEKCLYRVGFDTRRWVEGEAFVFDDTIEHTARNDSDQIRVVLIFDVWNPLLSPQDRHHVQALSAAVQAFNAAD